jgi:hypothetical protein
MFYNINYYLTFASKYSILCIERYGKLSIELSKLITKKWGW